jgi:hypothetical protein
VEASHFLIQLMPKRVEMQALCTTFFTFSYDL